MQNSIGVSDPDPTVRPSLSSWLSEYEITHAIQDCQARLAFYYIAGS